MKTLFLGVLVYAFSLASFAATMYEHANFGGRQVHIFPGEVEENARNENFNDELTGLWVESNECVLIAEHYNFNGYTRIYGPGFHDVGGPAERFNDKTSSWMVFRPYPGNSCYDSVAWLYENTNHGGRSFPMPYGLQMRDLFDFSDKASFIKVPYGLCAVTYNNSGFSGTKNAYTYANDGFLASNDDISSWRTVSNHTLDCSSN